MSPIRRFLAASLTALVAATTLTATVAVPAASAASSADDYPYRADSTQAADNWGFTKRQCVSFAAWRLAQHHAALHNGAENWGSAYAWDAAAARQGFRVGTRPAVGAIAQWHADERSPWYANGSRTANGYVQAGPYGHVGYVRSVYSDGSVLLEQYNMSGNRSYSTMRVKAPRYLYLAG